MPLTFSCVKTLDEGSNLQEGLEPLAEHITHARWTACAQLWDPYNVWDNQLKLDLQKRRYFVLRHVLRVNLHQ